MQKCDNVTEHRPAQALNLADHIRDLHGMGFAVVPAVGKVPQVKFEHLTERLPLEAVLRRAAKLESEGHTVTLVTHVGLTRVWRGMYPHKLIVVDCDDVAAAAWAEASFGWTPYMVTTRKGLHLGYLVSVGFMLPPNLHGLRAHGLHIDIKHDTAGTCIAVLPPSVHESGHVYSWVTQHPWSLSQLPVFPVQVLEAAVGKKLTHHYGQAQQTATEYRSNVAETETVNKLISETPCLSPSGGDHVLVAAPRRPPLLRSETDTNVKRRRLTIARMRSGSRNLGLNDALTASVAAYGSEGELRADAHFLNAASFSGTAKGPLSNEEVEAVVRSVLTDFKAGRIGRTAGKRIRITSSDALGNRLDVSGTELDVLLPHGHVGIAAYVMLAKFRVEHFARCQRGETFAVMADAMANAGTLPLSATLIAKCRDLLIDLGFIVLDRAAPPTQDLALGEPQLSTRLAIASS